MMNDDIDYEQLVVNESDISDSEYDPVIINGQGQSNIDGENDEVYQEIYETDINIDNSDNTWYPDSIRYLIFCWGKLKEEFTKCPDKKKKLLWQKVSEGMIDHGYYFDALACEIKWRSLKKIYMYNRTRTTKKDGTRHVINWKYFWDMDRIIRGNHMIDIVDHDGDGNDVDYGDDELSEYSGYENANSMASEHELITVSLVDDNVIKLKNEDEDSIYDLPTSNVDVNNENNENNENNDGEEIFGTSDIWTEAATKCLIEFWGNYRQRFLLAAQGKKRILWNEISKELRQHGHFYSGVVCDRKWRLLKANYLKRREKYKTLGVNSVKWQYYHDIDRLLGVPIETISWNMDSTMCLIDCFDNHKEKFMKAATGEKILVWKEISEEMRKSGYSYSPRACDNKWRTLKNRFHKNRMRADRNKKVIWVYYNKIDSILKELNKENNPKVKDTSSSDVNDQANEKDEHDYIKSPVKQDYSVKSEAITELKDLFKSRSHELDQRLKEIEDNQRSKDKAFHDLQQQTLDALKRANELETRKLTLLEQLVSRLPNIVNN